MSNYEIILEFNFNEFTVADREFLRELSANGSTPSTITNFIRMLEIAQKHTNTNIYDFSVEHVPAIVESFLIALQEYLTQFEKRNPNDKYDKYRNADQNTE